MKMNTTILVALFFIVTGFTWGESKETSYPSSNKKTVNSAMTPNYSGSTTVANSPEQRASALRTLASGDEATRKARLASLTRIGAAMSKRRQQQTQSQQ